MTYFGFLLRFIGIPLLILAALTAWDLWRGRRMRHGLDRLPAGWILLAHVAAAVIWTTPWDNYLVATGVWSYDPALVTGITLGWVPIEEYTFFVVQTLLTGLWVLWLARRERVLGITYAQSPASGPQPLAPSSAPLIPKNNLPAVGVAALLWLASILPALLGWRPGNYLALEVGWLLPPVLVQLAVGAQVLWRQRRLVALALLPPAVYLSAADVVAIRAGTWSIAPDQTTGLLLAGILPVEEAIFFLLTNTLIVFGMILLLGTDRLRAPSAPPAARD